MKVKVQIDEGELKKLVVAHIQKAMGDVRVDPQNVSIETKSNQNYRSEWEGGAGFRAVYEADV